MSEASKMMQYEANKKSAGIAYLLWFFFGMLGAHRFYLKKTGTAVTILLLTIFSTVLMIVGIGFFMIIIPAIWVFIDLFLIPGMARKYNTELASKLEMAA
ncbi:MAG: TM2 domain-containing protein [Methanosarcinales archaeon]